MEVLARKKKGELGMMYRRDMKNKSLDDFGEARPKAAVKGRRPERAVRPFAAAPVLAAATAMK
jgi:hypothetical protein